MYMYSLFLVIWRFTDISLIEPHESPLAIFYSLSSGNES